MLYFTLASVSPPLPAAPPHWGARCTPRGRSTGPWSPPARPPQQPRRSSAPCRAKSPACSLPKAARWGAAASPQPPVPPPQALSAACKVGRVPLGIFRGTTRAPDGSQVRLSTSINLCCQTRCFQLPKATPSPEPPESRTWAREDFLIFGCEKPRSRIQPHTPNSRRPLPSSALLHFFSALRLSKEASP